MTFDCIYGRMGVEEVRDGRLARGTVTARRKNDAPDPHTSSIVSNWSNDDKSLKLKLNVCLVLYCTASER